MIKTLDDALNTPGVIPDDYYVSADGSAIYLRKYGNDTVMINGHVAAETLRRIADHLDPQPVANMFHGSLGFWPDFTAPPRYANPAEGWEDPRLPNFKLIWSVARKHGYAVGLHGSMVRDCDLIAAPWVDNPSAPEKLVAALCEALDARQIGTAEKKPIGRVALTLQIDGWFKPIDISIMPAANTASVIPEGWRLVPVELLQFDITGYPGMEMRAIAQSQRQCDRAERGFGADAVTVLEEAEELLKAGLADIIPKPLRTEAEVRAEARREALKEAAKAAYGTGAYRVDAKTGKVTPLNHADVTAAAIRALIEKEPQA